MRLFSVWHDGRAVAAETEVMQAIDAGYFDLPQHLQNGLTGLRMSQGTTELDKGNEDKSTLGDPRVWDNKPGFADDPIFKEEDVDVDKARAPPSGWLTSKPLLNRFEVLQ